MTEHRSEDQSTTPAVGRRKSRITVPIGPTETIRNRLQMTKQEFSRALGFSDNAYNDMSASGEITKTAALAAEALMRRQAATSEDEVRFLVRVSRGVPHVTPLEGASTMTLDGRRFLLIPERAT